MKLESVFGLFALFMLVVQIATCAIAAWRCRQGGGVSGPVRSGKVSVVRTVCGLERFPQTLESSFLLNHPDYELLFCVARADDPVAPVIRSLMARYPHVKAQLLVGDDRISANPKLNNMLKGWRAARGNWIVFADSNIILPADYITRVQDAWRGDTGLVSAPPAGGAPENWWAEVECALLNSYQARWQYVVDSFGYGFGQGKTLAFRREQLLQMGFDGLAGEPAEDAAATKLVRRSGRKVRLAAPPFMQPLGVRRLSEVWGRHLRWARLRRITFPLQFVPEILAGSFAPVAAAVLYAVLQAEDPAVLIGAYVTAWYACEYALASAAGWPATGRSLLSFVIRDLCLPSLWIAAWFGGQVAWNGASIPLERRPHAVDS